MRPDFLAATDEAPLLDFDVTTVLADHVAFNRHLWTLPVWRQAQVSAIMTTVTLAPLAALAVSLSLAWALDGTACDLDAALGFGNRGLFFAKILGGILVASAATAGALWAWRRFHIEKAVRRALLRRPHIRADDPQLRETTHIAFYPRGYRVAGETAAYAYSWTYTKRFDETADHMFVMAEPTFGFIIPKRDLAPDTLLTIREVAKQVHEP